MLNTNFWLTFYNLFICLTFPIIVIRLLIKSLKNSDYRKRFLERLAIFPSPNFDSNSIWIHAVSVGESVASFPIIKLLMQKFPNNPFVVTSTTPTGSKTILKNLKDKIFHVYLPYDLPNFINKFIKKTKPTKLVIMETELWPNLILLAKKNNIDVYIVNARLSDKSANGYLKISTLTKLMLQSIKHISAQYQQDLNNFIKIGANKNSISADGNIKFDIAAPIEKITIAKKLKEQFLRKFVICAASTHNGEEEIILNTFANIHKEFPNTLLVLVPRHPERFRTVETLIRSLNYNLCVRSKQQQVTPETSVYLADTMGELLEFYAASNIAIVGGSLIPIGGHNVLEPASVNVPVITGQYTHNFKYIIEQMALSKAIAITKNSDELLNKIKELILDENYRTTLTNNAANFLYKNKGAVNRICQHIT